MAKNILAVCDKDLSYIGRFLSYMKSRGNLPFKVAGFSTTESLNNYLNKNRIDILLLSDNVMPKGKGGLSPDKNDTDAVDLLENPHVAELVLFDDKNDLVSRQKHINKYKPIEEIIADILYLINYEENDQNSVMVKTPDILGIYSPLYSPEKHIFALALSNMVGTGEKALYIDMKRFSPLRNLVSDEGRMDLSDLIYFYRTNSKKLGEALLEAVVRYDNLDILFAPADMEDMDMISEEDWGNFMSEIKKCGNYDRVIIDVHEAFRRLETVFGLCYKVLVPLSDTKRDAKAMDELEKLCAGKEGDRFVERFTRVYINTSQEEDAFEKYIGKNVQDDISDIAEKLYYSGVLDSN